VRFARALPLVLLSVALLAGFAHTAAAQQCEASEHGMRPGADNLAALTETLKACAGKTVHLAAGTYELNPNGFAPGLTVPSGTTIAGDGPGQTVVRIGGGGNLQAILWIRNTSNVTIRGIRFEGTSYDSGCSRHLDYGHAIYIYSDAGDHPAVENVNISGNLFYNFNGQSWITANAQDGSPGIGINSRIVIENNVFDSDGSLRGSCAGTGGIGYPAAMVWLHGSNQSAQGIIANVSIVSNTFNAGYIKSAVAIWSGTNHIMVQGNTIRNAGLHLPAASGELGRYAISIYNSAHDATHELPGLHPDTVSVVGNEIINPVSCGIYVAAAKNIEIAHNRISGQSDRFDGTLPKGAIALNHVENVYALHDNELTGNYIGISSAASEVTLGNNRIVPGPGGSATKIRGGDPNSR
jgi:hypothetical protein